MNFKTIDVKLFNDNIFMSWKERWKQRLKKNQNKPEISNQLMRKTNPLVIPRNHIIEGVLDEANENKLVSLKKLLKVLDKPYLEQENINNYQLPSNSSEKYQTFCGT